MSWCILHQIARWQDVSLDLRDRFAGQLVDGITTNASGCWLFAGRRNPTSGYAVAHHAGGRVFVHRWLTWHLKEELKPGHELHHVCGGTGEQDTRHCIRPAHLAQVLPGDHRVLTRLREQMVAAAEPGARFYQTSPGETGRTVAFARAHDLPRHEVDHMEPDLSSDRTLVALWRLVIPDRFGIADS